MEDDILERYRREAAEAMEVEAKKRIDESTDPEMERQYRNTSLKNVDDLLISHPILKLSFKIQPPVVN